MKVHFTSLKNIKSAAKKICALSSALKLSMVQECLAKTCGYQDWFDLNQNHQRVGFDFGQNSSSDSLIDFHVNFITKLSKALNLSCGDIQHILAHSYIMGTRKPSLEEQLSIRTKCFATTEFKNIFSRSPGEIGKRKDTQEAVILKSFEQGGVAHILGHNTLGRTIIADFEYISPKKKLDLFIPLRLYLPYGYDIEEGGSKVIFSRDYKPLWRITSGKKPERLNPWKSVKHIERKFLGPADQPWRPEEEKYLREQFLIDNGVETLPKLVEYLPKLVFDPTVKRLDDIKFNLI